MESRALEKQERLGKDQIPAFLRKKIAKSRIFQRQIKSAFQISSPSQLIHANCYEAVTS